MPRAAARPPSAGPPLLPLAVRARRAVAESVTGLPRAFWWLFTSTLVNRLGSFVATFLALFLTTERGYSASYAGLVGALYGLGGVLASVVAGVLTDRLGRRPTMMCAQVCTAVSVAALAFMEHPVAIAVTACAVGMASNASRPAVQAMIADLVPAKDRVRAFSLNYWAVNLGFAVSSSAAGLIAQYSYRVLFFGEAALVLLCALVVFAKLPESRPDQGSGQGSDQGSEQGSEQGSGTSPRGRAAVADGAVSLWTVLRDGRFMTVVALNLVMATMIQQAFVALPVTMGKEGFSSTDFGMVIAANGVLIVLLQIPVTRMIERRDPGLTLMVSALLMGYGFGLNAFAGSVGFFALAVLVWTLGEIVYTPTQMGLVVRLSPTHGRGRYQGVFTLSWALASLGAPLLGGLVIDGLGSPALWAGCALLGTAAAAVYGVLVRRMREEDSGGGPEGNPEGAAPEGEGVPGPRKGSPA